MKHNAITAENPLCISISTNETPALVVQNNYQPKPEPAESMGQGLKNISERYRLLGESAIRYENDGKNFTVILPLLSTGYLAGSVNTSAASGQ
ncbi:MAG: hypothetical protein INR69_21130 [Mucilaginibacter polytrichastri]|nr:hypothetical protein [Mucilaginibacter polytrichastri]